MNDYVNDFYIACELVDDDLDLLAEIIIMLREKSDKTRPNVIETYCNDCKFDLLHKYTSRICDMNYKEFIQIRNKAKNNLIKKQQIQLTLFDL